MRLQTIYLQCFYIDEIQHFFDSCPFTFTIDIYFLNYLNMVFCVCIGKQENIFVERTSNMPSVFGQRRIIQLLTNNQV